jgi:uncharacterized membrane protein
MTVTVHLLAWVFLILSGLLAGTLFMVEVAIVPTFGALPADRWVQVHRLLDRRFDPLMPRVNKLSLAVCASLVVLAGSYPAKIAFAVAGLGTIGVAAVSEAFNVRLNRRLEAWDAAALPAEWPRLRSRWASANRARTLLALAAFAGAVLGGLLL